MSRLRAVTAPALKWRTRILQVHDRLEVWCDVRHLLGSGTTVAELFDRVLPELEQAARIAAARDRDQPSLPSPVKMHMEFGEPDPDIWLVLHDPAACLAGAGAGGNLDKLLHIVQSVIDAYKAGGKL